jgi:hypothetical protein
VTARGLVLVTLAVGCAPAELRIPPPSPADASAPDLVEAAPERQPVRRCFPKPTASGPDQPGDFCVGPEQCQHGPDEVATCVPRDDADNIQKLARCHRFTRAALGEPCVLTLVEAGGVEGAWAANGQTVPDTGAFCDVHDGLVCDETAHVCRPLPTLGESCLTPPHCTPGAHCDHATCVPGKALGEACYSILDYLDQSQCALGSHCDLRTDTCQPTATVSQPCDNDPHCSTGLCNAGRCAPPGTCRL